MHHFWQGKPTRQAHKGIPEGLYEEEQGHLGFYGPVSHLIRKKPSTRWVEIEGDLKPRLYDLVQLKPSSHFQRMFYNNDIEVGMWWVNETSDCAIRNADGDVVLFCHKGEGSILTEYGELTFTPGEYIVIPKCIAFLVIPNIETQFLYIENKNSHYIEPDRGMVGRHAVYDMQTIGRPDLEKQHETLKNKSIEVKKIRIQHLRNHTTYKYAECAFADVVGWKGDLFPYTLHMNNMMPLMSHRAHLPPSAHSTFVARNFVICTFLPRPLEEDDDALKVPFYHQNMDYDEILFYHDGDFFSRDNLHAGMLSFHPAGFPHGPHPKAIQKSKSKTHTDEYAVMVDTRFPLHRDEVLNGVEVKDYWKSWMK